MSRQFAEIAELREALDEFGWHNDGCSGKWPEYRCKCGWRETAKRLGVRDGEAEGGK